MSLVTEFEPAESRLPSADLPRRTVPDFDFVLFGAAGELATRKLLPALLERETDGVLPPQGRILCIGREPFGTEEFVMRTLAQVRDLADELLVRFSRRIRYLQMDVTDPSSYAELAALLEERQAARFFYLAVASNLFAPICENLATLGLATPDSRVVLERPIGEGLESSRVISGTVGEAFSEGRIYRIDHYLGKEAAHSLMILRFASVDCAAMENIPTAD